MRHMEQQHWHTASHCYFLSDGLSGRTKGGDVSFIGPVWMYIFSDHGLHPHKVAIQSQGRATGLMVLEKGSPGLNLTTMATKEKDDLLETPITAQGLLGEAVTSTQKRCKGRKRHPMKQKQYSTAMTLCCPETRYTSTTQCCIKLKLPKVTQPAGVKINEKLLLQSNLVVPPPLKPVATHIEDRAYVSTQV